MAKPSIHVTRNVIDHREVMEFIRKDGRATNRGGHFFNTNSMPYKWSIPFEVMQHLEEQGLVRAVMSCRGGPIYVVAYVPTGQLLRRIEIH